MPTARSSPTRWRDKLHNHRPPKIVRVPVKWQKRFGKGTMVIPTPLDVDTIVRSVRRGRVITQGELRTRAAG